MTVPFRIASVAPLHQTTAEERAAALEEAGYNVYRIPSRMVSIDLLTDSGMVGLSERQQARIFQADEAYAGSESYERLHAVVHELTGMPEIIPVPQGRAAEALVCHLSVSPGDTVPGNTYFNTTRANIEAQGAQAIDCPIPEARLPHVEHPFKGNVDTAALQGELDSERVPFVVVTITDNSSGGQPVSLRNIQEVSAQCRRAGVPLYLDACRFAENAYLARQRDPEISGQDPLSVARAIFDLADGCWISAKKDGLSPIGGVLTLRDKAFAERCRQRLRMTQGLPTYGGLSGASLEVMAQGLVEVVDESYLAHRVGMLAKLGADLDQRGVPILHPTGGHAVYLDAAAIAPHLSSIQFPGLAIVVDLYARAGIRASEVGSVMFGRSPDGSEQPWGMELVRLAVPRRVYTQEHMEIVAAAVGEMYREREALPAYTIVHEPEALRHFDATFARA